MFSARSIRSIFWQVKPTKVLLLVLSLAIFLQSCLEDPEGIAKSKRELLTQTTWRVNKVTLDDRDDPSTNDALIGLRASFSQNGTYSITKNGTQTGVWRFSSDEQAILLDAVQQSDDTWLIRSLENRKFEASYRENNETIQLFMSPN